MLSLSWFVRGSSSVHSYHSSNKSCSLMSKCAAWAFLFFALQLSSVAQSGRQVLHNHVRPEISGGTAPLVGTMPLDEEMDVSIVLPLRDQAGLKDLLARLYDPKSPDYRHFIGVADFADRFGPTPQDYRTVVAFARAHGLQVTGDHANRLVVPVHGSVQKINSAFHVQMNFYQHPTENRTFFSPDREPSLDLDVQVAHISGLNNFSLPKPMLSEADGLHPMVTVSGSGPGGAYLASDMRAAYYGGTALTGTGQSVGLLEFSGYTMADVTKTFSTAGQSYNVPINNVLLDGATGAGSGGYEGEVVLDIVQAIGMAPGLDQVRVYIGQGLDDANILSTMASENIAKQISCSWAWLPADPKTDDVFFQEFAAQGQSFLTASGDSGAFYSAISPFFYPQEDAYVTAVGGTHLTTNAAGGSWASEVAWHTGSGASGGGISPDGIPIPSWQSGVANSSNGGSNTLRNVPDVAMEGDFDNYLCYNNGSCSGGWAGTSFAAPRWAAFIALVNQQALEAGNAPAGGIGFLNPTLYQIGAGAIYANDFHDQTSGNNQTGNQPLWYSAVAGYDLVTGWGSPTGQNLIDALAGPQVPGFWIQASTNNVAIGIGTSSSTTLTVTDAGGFSGNVDLAITSALPTGVTASWSQNPTSTNSVLTLAASNSAPASTTNLTITGTSGSLTATTNLTVAVHAPTFVISESPSSVSMNQSSSTTSTITITPQYGFSGSVNLALTGLPSGVTASWGTNPTPGTSVLTLLASSSAVGGTYTLTITGTSGSLTVTNTMTLSVHAPSFTVSASSPINVGQGSSGTSYVSINSFYGFTGDVTLSASGLPSGVTASFATNPTTYSSVLTLTATSSANIGSSTITITGTSGNLTASTNITLAIFAPTFTLSAPSTLTVGQGLSAATNVYIYGQYGFNSNVTFNVAGLPAGVSALWSPNPATNNTTLTLSAAASAAVGDYPLTITGVSGNTTKTVAMTLSVKVPTFTLSGSILVNIGQGHTATGYVYVNPQYGFTGSTNLSVSGLPSGVTASFSPNPSTSNSVLTFTATSTAAVGQYTITVTGTSGSQSASMTMTVGVYVPSFTVGGFTAVSVGQGTSATGYLYLNAQYGFSGNVSLSVSGLPAGVTATFSPNPTTYSSTITFTASGSAALGQYPITITGTSGSQTATMSATLGVYAPAFTISSYSNPSVGQGTTGNGYVYVNTQYGFNSAVSFSISGLPSGVTATFSPNPTTYSSTITFTASNTAATGQYPITITGTSGVQTASTTITLGVYTPTFTIYAGSPTLGQGGSTTAGVYLYPQYGFNSSVTFSVSGLPAGVTASFSPNPSVNSTTMTLAATSAAPTGQYALTITGTSGAITATTTATLTIATPAFTISPSSTSITLNQSATTITYIYMSAQGGFSAPVTFSASGLPNGVTASFSPNPSTYSTTMTLTSSGTAASGASTFAITGTSGGLTATANVNLTVNAAAFTLSPAPSQIGMMPGQSTKATVSVVPINGFGGSVALSISGLPSGVTATFTPASTTGASSLSLAASRSATAGSTTATITGTSGSVSTSVPLVITVKGAQSATSTTLSITSGSNTVTTVPSGAAITLTASVTTGSSNLSNGQVLFCDLTLNSVCDPLHAFGSAQLTGVGSASLKWIPGPGAHSYKAFFTGINSVAASSSDVSALTVTGTQATVTTLSQSGSAGHYSLTATVTGQGPVAPSGSVSFQDTTSNIAPVGAAVLAPSQSTLTAGTAQSTSITSVPRYFAVGDFNGDGKLDIAATNSSSNTVTVLLGNGDGTFSNNLPAMPTGSQPGSIVTADFNGDGKLDLAIANTSSSSITIYLGNGDGTFTASQLSPQTGSYAAGMVTGDFNNDGNVDLAVTDQGTSHLTVLLGHGDGTFTAASSVGTITYYSQYIAVGDFNGDGNLDLALSNTNNGTVGILLGNGDGTFTTASTITSNNPEALAVGDFNGDGIQDLAVSNYYFGTVTILFGKGDGTFLASPSPVQTGYYPLSIAVTDLNHDGVQDLVVSSSYSGNLSTFLGKGDGTFATAVTTAIVNPAQSFAVGDFTADGIPDIAVGISFPNTISVLPIQLAQVAKATANNVSPIGTGTHAVDASYPGDTSFAASVSTTVPLTAQVGTPIVTVNPSATTIATTDTLSAAVSVSGGTGNPVPTGSVVLSSGSYSSGSTALVGGNATISVPAGTLNAGNDQLTVSYTPDAGSSVNYTSASGSGSVSVVKASPSVTVSTASSSFTTAQTVSVSVALGGTGTLTATGSVTLVSGSYTSPAATVSNGSATITVPAGSLPPGTNPLNVTYSPDVPGSALYSGATGNKVITITRATPSVTVTPSLTNILLTQGLTASVVVSGGAGAPAASGSVVLSSGSFTSAAASVTSGMATIVVPAGSLATGANVLSVAYTPDSASNNIYTGAAGSSTVTVAAIGTASPNLTATASAAVVTDLQSDTVAVSVTGGVGQPTPTGTVTLTSGSYTAQQTLANGTASFATPAGAFGNGTDTLTVAYSGDPTYAIKSTTTTVTVAPVIAGASSPASVSAGATGTSTVTLTAGTYAGTMNLSCTLTASSTNAQNLPVCSLNPVSVKLSTSTTSTVAVSITTVAASTASLEPSAIPQQWGRRFGGVAIACMVFLSLPRRRRWTGLLILVCGLFAAGVTGCGGSSSGSGSHTSTPGTTAGAYMFTVTASDSANSTIRTSTTITLNVQ